MKTLIIMIFLATMGTISFAQDTAYVSQKKVTALFFKTSVKIVSKLPSDMVVIQKENGLITVKALKDGFSPGKLDVQDQSTHQIYHIAVEYSFGKAGRRIQVGERLPVIVVVKSPVINYAKIGALLASGRRSDVIDRKKNGGIKAWVNKLSLANNKLFFRLDIRNKSNLPYAIDFVRFYIRDLKTVARMASHEQEIIPIYSNLRKHTSITKSKEIAKVFGFHRFSLSEDQAINVELYERNGNRHLYLQIKQKDIDNLKIISQPEIVSSSMLASNRIKNNNY